MSIKKKEVKSVDPRRARHHNPPALVVLNMDKVPLIDSGLMTYTFFVTYKPVTIDE